MGHEPFNIKIMKSSFWLTASLTSLLLLTGLTLTTPLMGQIWDSLPPMPTARGYCAAAALDGKIFVFGGAFSTTSSSDDVEMYDIALGSWEVKKKMPVKMCGMAAVADTAIGKIYLVGGAPTFNELSWNKVYEYNPVLDTFLVKTPLPQERGFMAACYFNHEIYIIGGLDGAIYKSVLKYNPEGNNGWETVASLNKTRFLASASVMDGKIYVTGGDETYSFAGSATTEVFDGVNWLLLDAEMQQARFMHGSGVINNSLYVFGGAAAPDDLMSTERLDFPGGEPAWDFSTDMTSIRRVFAYTTWGNVIYVAGGLSGGILQNKFEKFSVVSAANDRQAKREGQLHQNYPNPFAYGTTIQYEVTSPGNVEITLQDVTGKVVKTAVNGYHFPGSYSVILQAEDLDSGVFFYTMKNEEGYFNTRKMVVLK